MQTELIILGCGDSAGTPRIGNAWGNCDPHEPKNIRTRPSVCVRNETTTIVIDTGPDFKQQINRENIQTVDAILYTHAHSDHVNGMDDIKPFCDRAKKRMPIYLMDETLAEMKQRFIYLFEQQSKFYPVVVDPFLWTEEHMGKAKQIGDIDCIPFVQDHGMSKTLGYRFGNVGYSTDLVDLSDASVDILKGIDTWIVDGANLWLESPCLHMNLKTIQAFNERIQAKTIYLTHMKYDLDYQTLLTTLPEGIFPAYDGLRIPVRYQ